MNQNKISFVPKKKENLQNKLISKFTDFKDDLTQPWGLHFGLMLFNKERRKK